MSIYSATPTTNFSRIHHEFYRSRQRAEGKSVQPRPTTTVSKPKETQFANATSTATQSTTWENTKESWLWCLFIFSMGNVNVGKCMRWVFVERLDWIAQHCAFSCVESITIAPRSMKTSPQAGRKLRHGTTHVRKQYAQCCVYLERPYSYIVLFDFLVTGDISCIHDDAGYDFVLSPRRSLLGSQGGRKGELANF